MPTQRFARRIASAVLRLSKALYSVLHDGQMLRTALAQKEAELQLKAEDLKQKNVERVSLLEQLNEANLQLSRFGSEAPFVPNGHFYSPVPMRGEAERHVASTFSSVSPNVPGIDMRGDAQLEMLGRISSLYADLPFNSGKQPNLRYYYENPAFGYGDAIILNGILRLFKPTRVVEVGSGYSSAMMLDTNEQWLDSLIDFTFIEPYPDLLKSLLKDWDAGKVHILGDRVQDVDASVFDKLERDDILFVDSTHVSKTGSDVNHIIFNVLPDLASGVLVHFHDIIYPFEYPEEWVKTGIAWNEAYLLRAFLMNNNDFEVVIHNNYLWRFHRDRLAEALPLAMKNPGAGLWIRKK